MLLIKKKKAFRHGGAASLSGGGSVDEALLSEAIHHGFLFRKLTLGGEHDGTEEPDYRKTHIHKQLLSVSKEPQKSALIQTLSYKRNQL